jgi:preprotein translocase subunit SecG
MEHLIITLLYILFVLAAIVLVVVVLLQEGKGGGFGGALGGAGEATFGVGASGINRFTGWVAVVFLVSALGIHVLNQQTGAASVIGDDTTISAPPVDGGAAPQGNSGQ